MIATRGVSLFVSVGAIQLLACAHPARRPVEREALQLVSHFVELDTLGVASVDSIFQLMQREECYGVGADHIEPVTSVAVAAPEFSGDTALIVVEYQSIGRAWSLGESAGRPNAWFFERFQHTVSDTFRVVSAPSGRLWITCGPHHGNRVSVRRMAREYARMSTAAKAAWDSALADADARTERPNESRQ